MKKLISLPLSSFNLPNDLYRKTDNSEFFTHEQLFCSICKKISKVCLHIKQTNGKNICLACDECNTLDLFKWLFTVYPDNFLLIRRIVSFNLEIKRKPIGTSLRYKIFKKNNFKCVVCGNTAHIISVSNGGATKENNLRILCWEHNIGKGNRY